MAEIRHCGSFISLIYFVKQANPDILYIVQCTLSQRPKVINFPRYNMKSLPVIERIYISEKNSNHAKAKDDI